LRRVDYQIFGAAHVLPASASNPASGIGPANIALAHVEARLLESGEIGCGLDAHP
jgi:hypothetical protein